MLHGRENNQNVKELKYEIFSYELAGMCLVPNRI